MRAMPRSTEGSPWPGVYLRQPFKQKKGQARACPFPDPDAADLAYFGSP
jgi:hypothetical protein